MPVTTQRQGRVATLTLDRPPLNILDLELIAQLDAALSSLADDPQLHLVVLRGAGDRAFSTGVAIEDHAADQIDAMLGGFHGAIRKLRNLPAVTLAVVHGHCLGGGCELATSCDLVLATDDARFGVPEVRLGCFPPVAAALYPRRLGPARTLELLLTGRTLDCAEAEQLGLVTWRVPGAELESRLAERIAALTDNSAAVARLIKQAVHNGVELPFDAALARTEDLYRRRLAELEDMTEGLEAFRHKRPPVWRHR